MNSRELRSSVGFDEHRCTVVIMFGRGGDRDFRPQLVELAVSMPDRDWVVLGLESDLDAVPPNLRYAGWIDDPAPFLRAADLVITAAGHNSVMEVGHSRCRFIAVAEERPFDEQRRKAHVLDREGLAVGLQRWPPVGEWEEIVKRAEQLDPSRWDQVFRLDGAAQAAEHIRSIAQHSADSQSNVLAPTGAAAEVGSWR